MERYEVIIGNKRKLMLSFALLLIGVVVGYFLLSQGNLVLILLVALGVLTFFILQPAKGILLYFRLKPLIEFFWNLKALSILSLQRLTGVGVPSFLLLYLFAVRFNFLSAPLIFPISLFALSNVLSVIFAGGAVLKVVENLFRVLGGVGLYFGAQVLFTNREQVDKLISAVTFSMIFPIFFSFLQLLGFLPYTRVSSIGGSEFVRLTGGYHDAFSLIFYFIIGTPFLLYRIYEGRSKYLFTILARYVSLFFIGIIIMLSFLRTAYLIIPLEVFLFAILFSKRRLAILSGLSSLAAVIYGWRFFSAFFADLLVLFGGPGNIEDALHGRILIWQIYVNNYLNADLIGRIFGLGLGYTAAEAGHAAHNDFLRVLVSNGMLGLVTYGVLIVLVFRHLRLAISTFRSKEDHFFTDFTRLTMIISVSYLLISMNLWPSSSPILNWYMWLFLGIVFGIAKGARTRGLEGRPSQLI